MFNDLNVFLHKESHCILILLFLKPDVQQLNLGHFLDRLLEGTFTTHDRVIIVWFDWKEETLDVIIIVVNISVIFGLEN